MIGRCTGGARISPRRGRQLPGEGGRQHTIFAKNSQKLHEIERIWAPGGGASKILLCRSATEMDQLTLDVAFAFWIWLPYYQEILHYDSVNCLRNRFILRHKNTRQWKTIRNGSKILRRGKGCHTFQKKMKKIERNA